MSRLSTVKAIIFDWGRTLHDPEGDCLSDGVHEVIESLAQRYVLAIVSLAKSESPEVRLEKIRESAIGGYFTVIRVGNDDKARLYEAACKAMTVFPATVAVVDDQVRQGVRWGAQHGATTVWFRKREIRQRLPAPEVVNLPDFTVTSFRSLGMLFSLTHDERTCRNEKGHSFCTHSLAV